MDAQDGRACVDASVATAKPSTSSPFLDDAPYDGDRLLVALEQAIDRFQFAPDDQRRMMLSCRDLRRVLDGCEGNTLGERWYEFEQRVWLAWRAGRDRGIASRWSLGVRAIVTARVVRPSWSLVGGARVGQWTARLHPDDALAHEISTLRQAIDAVTWVSSRAHMLALQIAIRLMLVRGYESYRQITEQDLKTLPRGAAKGCNVLDAALCTLGVFDRTPQRGTERHRRRARRTPEQLVDLWDIPERFRDVTRLYLQTYAARVSDAYHTVWAKGMVLARFWRFIDERYPEVRSSADVLPAHARAFIPYMIEEARNSTRSRADGEVGTTAHAWLVYLRVFFSDLCTWATEEDSPFATMAPRTIPLTRRDLVGIGFEKARRRQEAWLTATVLDLEREMPNIRAYAFRRWQESKDAMSAEDLRSRTKYVEAFWDWALLELLVQSGLRIEEACELTTLDILRRNMPDGRVYYMLHVKPSKYDRARVVPIGDGLGRVIAEIIRQVKRFYDADAVPECDHWDHNEKRPWPRAPYLLQGRKHPSAIGVTTIRDRLAALSRAAGARRADGTPLSLHPHDCRRVFASEHLNSNTPVHVIQALLGHATIDTVMVYAKLYPTRLVEEYRQAVRAAFMAVHGEESLRNPTPEEWAAFSTGCSMRDMGTHICALPTGEHCPRGLVCLGCVHAQPKKSAVPLFRRMLASHERALAMAKTRGEPAGQIAAREMEVARLQTALRRADELSDDVAAAIEGAVG